MRCECGNLSQCIALRSAYLWQVVFVIGSRTERIDLVVVTVNVTTVVLSCQSCVHLCVFGDIKVCVRTNLFSIVSKLGCAVDIELEQTNCEL